MEVLQEQYQGGTACQEAEGRRRQDGRSCWIQDKVPGGWRQQTVLRRTWVRDKTVAGIHAHHVTHHTEDRTAGAGT